MSDGNLELFARYQAGRGLSPKTIQRRRISIGRFATALEPLPIERATGRHVEEWLGSIPMASTRRAYRSDLMAFYTWADKRDICPNPVLKTDGIRVPKSLPRPVAASHLEAVLAAAEPDVRLMIALAAYVGLRCAEISALQASDIDLNSEAPTIAVRSGKGNKDRIVPVHPRLAAMLRGKRGRIVPVKAQRVSVKVAEHLRSLGIDATAHKLRATFGTELARTTEGNIILVASLMGHESIQTSMAYVGWAGGAGTTAINGMYPDRRVSTRP